MTLPTDRALEFLSTEAGPVSRTWELRGALPVTMAGPGPVAFDGGARFEQVGGHDALWIVGAGPAALDGAGRGPAGADGAGWEGAVAWLAAELRSRAAEAPAAAARFAAAARVPVESVRAKLHARARAWCVAGGTPRAEIAWGARLEAHAPHRSSSAMPVGVSDAMSAADTLMSAADIAVEKYGSGGEDLAADPARPPAGALPSGPPLGAGYRGPVVLPASAAAWFVHEMGHAALEWTGDRPASPPAVTVEDDPTRAPWPCGFTWDDAGQPAGRVVLWGEGATPARAARRSGSIRDAAVPSLASTRCVIGVGAAPPVDPGPGVPWIGPVRAARFDPSSRTVILAFESYFSRSSDDKWFVHHAPGTLVAGVEEVWPGVRGGHGRSGIATDFARCTRQGVVIAVMVGAPTLVLDPVHVRLR